MSLHWMMGLFSLLDVDSVSHFADRFSSVEFDTLFVNFKNLFKES